MDKPVINKGACKICGKPAGLNGKHIGKQYWRSLCYRCKYLKDAKQQSTYYQEHGKEKARIRGVNTYARKLARKYRLDLTHCELCGWVGVCDIHHKDKDRNNTQRDNLQVICPNCHRNIHHPLVQSPAQSKGRSYE